MSSAVPQGSVNDGRRPLLVIPADDDDGFWKLAYLPDGRRVITGSDGGTVKVWNLENGGQEGTSMEHERKLYGLAVTRDGTKIISSAEGRVKVWDVELRKLVREWTCSGVCPKIAISPDDRLVAVGDWDVVTIYSMEGGQVNQSIDIGDVWCMSFSPNGGRLACGTDYDIRVYDIKTGARILGPLKGHNDNITRVVWSRDGERLFSGSWDNIRCWNSDTGEQIGHPWTGHTDWIDSLSLSPDGSTLASASEDKTVRFWDATTSDPIGQRLPHDEPVYDVSFSPSGEFVASIDNRKIYLWRVPWWGSVQSQISLADLGAPCNTVHLAQLSRFHPPPPYSTHIPGAGQVHHLDFDAVTPPSNHLTTTALVLNSLLDSPDTSATSDECSSVTPSEIDYILSGFSPSPSPPLHPIAPSTLSSPSLPIMEQQSQRSALRIGFPAVVDLTHHIIRINNQYSAVGSFGDVYRCRYLGHSVPIEVAVKAFRFTFTTDGNTGSKSKKMIHRELGIWRRLEHDNIVPFLGIAHGFGMEGTMSLVSLWMRNGSLHHFLEKYDNNLGVEHQLQFLQDIANGLQYLHSFPVVHGDLNCNNVLLDADYTARLADFGYASLVGNIPEALGYLQRSTARPGALRWSAPEQILSEEAVNRTTKSDIYSFGCIALQVLTGKQPWSEISADGAVILRLAKGHKPGRPKSRMMGDSHWCLIQECWSPMEERPTAEVIKSAIRQFLNDGPRSPPLHDLIQSWSNQVDHGAELLSSPSEVSAQGSSARFAQTLVDEHSISDTSSSYRPHEDEEYHTSLIAKRGRSTEGTVPSDDKHHHKRRHM